MSLRLAFTADLHWGINDPGDAVVERHFACVECDLGFKTDGDGAVLLNIG